MWSNENAIMVIQFFLEKIQNSKNYTTLLLFLNRLSLKYTIFKEPFLSYIEKTCIRTKYENELRQKKTTKLHLNQC